MNPSEREQTLVLIKPDALKNSLTGYVLSLLSEYHTGLLLAGAKIVNVNNMLAQQHYAEHKGKVFYPYLIDYLRGRLHYPDALWKQRVIAIVYQGHCAVKKIREICGPTNPNVARETNPGCIRSLGALIPIKDASGKQVGESMENLIHASASVAEAEREIKLWFKPNDIPPKMRAFETVESKEHFYYKNGQVLKTYQEGSICIFAPGDTVWKSDFQAIELIINKEMSPCSLEVVVAKYLINEASIEEN